MILDYMEIIGFFIIFSVPYVFLLNIIFNIIQIPFAVISRTAVYGILLFQTYLYALYFAVATASCIHAGYSAIPFAIIFSFALFGGITSAAKNTKDEGEHTYICVSGFLSVPAYIVMSFVPFLSGSAVIEGYMSACEWILNIPILGNILNFILPFFSFIACLFVCGNLLLVVFSLLGRSKSKV